MMKNDTPLDSDRSSESAMKAFASIDPLPENRVPDTDEFWLASPSEDAVPMLASYATRPLNVVNGAIGHIGLVLAFRDTAQRG